MKYYLLSLVRCGDQQLRRRACPEFVADRAKVLLEVILFYKLNSTSKERFTLDKTTHFVTMKLS